MNMGMNQNYGSSNGLPFFFIFFLFYVDENGELSKNHPRVTYEKPNTPCPKVPRNFSLMAIAILHNLKHITTMKYFATFAPAILVEFNNKKYAMHTSSRYNSLAELFTAMIPFGDQIKNTKMTILAETEDRRISTYL